MVATSGHWWAPVFGVLISLWIVLGGWAADQLIPNFTDGDAGTVVGTAIMTLGLVFAALTGLLAMGTGRTRIRHEVPRSESASGRYAASRRSARPGGEPDGYDGDR